MPLYRDMGAYEYAWTTKFLTPSHDYILPVTPFLQPYLSFRYTPLCLVHLVVSYLAICFALAFHTWSLEAANNGMQIRFTHLGCFMEEEGWIITQGCRDGTQMFILDTNDVGTTLLANGQKLKSDIDSWPKQISHVNY